MKVHLKLILLIDGTRIPSEIALRWMALDFTNEKSSLVQVMASGTYIYITVWCNKATIS